MQTLERTRSLTKKQISQIEKLVEESKAIGMVTSKGDGINERAAIVNQVSQMLGFSLARSGQESNEGQGWNNTLRWLDDNHPGWRGYTVQYPGGRIG